MKQPKTLLASILPLVFTGILCCAISTAILFTGIPANTKLSFVFLIFGGGGYVMYIGIKRLLEQENVQSSKQAYEQANQYWKPICDDLAQKNQTLTTEAEALRKRSVSVAPPITGKSASAEKPKEKAVPALPLVISDTYQVYALIKTEVAVSHYSRWKIVGRYADNLFELEVIRPDNQLFSEMVQLTAATANAQALESLSLHEELWGE